MGDFNHPDFCWEDHTARHMQSRRFLQSIDDNFLMQVLEEPMRRGALLDLVLMDKKGLVENVKVGGSLGSSDHEMVNFRILGGGSRAISRNKILDFRRANFGLFKELTWEESCGPGLSKAGGSKRAGLCLNVTSSMLRIGASLCTRNLAKEAGDPHG